jgi:hypothetical protein
MTLEALSSSSPRHRDRLMKPGKPKRAPQSRDIVGQKMETPRSGRYVQDLVKVHKAILAAESLGDLVRAEELKDILNIKGLKAAYREVRSAEAPKAVSLKAEPKDFKNCLRLIKRLAVELGKVAAKEGGIKIVRDQCQQYGIDFQKVIEASGEGSAFIMAYCNLRGLDHRKMIADEEAESDQGLPS